MFVKDRCKAVHREVVDHHLLEHMSYTCVYLCLFFFSQKPCPEDGSSIVNRFTFNWIMP